MGVPLARCGFVRLNRRMAISIGGPIAPDGSRITCTMIGVCDSRLRQDRPAQHATTAKKKLYSLCHFGPPLSQVSQHEQVPTGPLGPNALVPQNATLSIPGF